MPNNPSYIGHRERIREKFAAAGLDSFLDHEALELLLTYAVPRKDTKPIAWALLKNSARWPPCWTRHRTNFRK